MNQLQKFGEIIDRKPEQEFNDFLFEPKKHFQKLQDDIDFLEKLNKQLSK